MTLEVKYYRPRRRGPEAALEDIVAARVSELLVVERQRLWLAGSLPLGAGMPDLVAVTWKPQVSDLHRSVMLDAHVLAYVRRANRVRLDKIICRLQRPRHLVVDSLDALTAAGAVDDTDGVFSIAPPWREILPEIVAVESKVSNWQKAVAQAARNRIFSHRSYVALPDSTAARVRIHPKFSQLGIGIIAVGANNSVRVVRPARRRKPSVWTYYYELVVHVAQHIRSSRHGVYCQTG